MKLSDLLTVEQQEHLYETLLVSIDSHKEVLGNHKSEHVTAEVAEEHVSGIAYELRRKQVLEEIKEMLEE